MYNPAEYKNYLFRGHFDYLYDKVGLYDTLRNIVCHQHSATAISQAWQSLGGIEKRMLNFLENHDEQRIASDFFAGHPRKALPARGIGLSEHQPHDDLFRTRAGRTGHGRRRISGRDGRTTIFDYWCVDTVRRWRNGGKFEGKMLTAEEKQLQAYYQRVLTLCNSEAALSQGAFFDLTYANLHGWRFNEHRQDAFLRKHERELLLIVVNFDPATADLAINLPAHAFDVLQIPQNPAYTATDLLTGHEETLSLLPYQATDVCVEGYGAKILKFTLA